MRQLLQNKRAISEMVSYVLLIIIAVGVSGLVFAYIKFYVPKGQLPECPQDVGIVIKDYTCIMGTNPQLTLSLVNKGLLTVDAVQIKFEKTERRIRQNINKGPLYFSNNGLKPGEEYITVPYNVGTIVTSPGSYTVEIQPAMYTDRIKEGYSGGKEIAYCQNAIITQLITCS